jgi:enolase
VRISEIGIKIIQDSRGEDTLEAEIASKSNRVKASVPTGKSKGKFEVVSLNPSDALEKFEEIRDEIIERDFESISDFDKFLLELDGTVDKSNLGGNLILVLSIAFTRLFAQENGLQTFELIAKVLGKKPQKFPYLFFNLIGGGLHARESLPFQEYILVTKFNSPEKGLTFAKKIVERLRQDILKNFGEERIGDEGTFSIKSDDPETGLEVLKRNLEDKENIGMALDVAASSFHVNKSYKIGGRMFASDELLKYYIELSEKYELLSIEDPFAETDRNGFARICKEFKDKVWIIGDDLTVTNTELIKRAYDEKEINGVIIKPNQIGSVSETIDAIEIAQSLGLRTIVSHRSGETNDDFIADLAFGASADGLKAGAPTQPERLAKYERLIEIERALTHSLSLEGEG